MIRVLVAGVAAIFVFVGCGSATIAGDEFESPAVALSDITLGTEVSSLTVAVADVRFGGESDVATTVIGDVCAGAEDGPACVIEHDRLLDTDPTGWPAFGQCVMCESEPARLVVATGPDGDGWQFVDSRLIEICDPIVERTTLHEMSSDGEFEEIRFVDESEDGICI